LLPFAFGNQQETPEATWLCRMKFGMA